MLKNVLNPSGIGRLMIALFFFGGLVYAVAFGGFVVETEASSCCGGVDAEHFSSSSCCDTESELTCTAKSRSGHNKPRHCSLSNGKQCANTCSNKNMCNIKGCNGYNG